MPKPFERTRSIEDRDTDALGHVNNVVWVGFIAKLAEAHSDAVGWSFEKLRANGGLWIVRRHVVDYRGNAVPGQRVREQTWVSEMRGARCERETRFLRGGDEDVLVEARTTWAYVDAGTHRPRRIPRELQELFMSENGE